MSCSDFRGAAPHTHPWQPRVLWEQSQMSFLGFWRNPLCFVTSQLHLRWTSEIPHRATGAHSLLIFSGRITHSLHWYVRINKPGWALTSSKRLIKVIVPWFQSHLQGQQSWFLHSKPTLRKVLWKSRVWVNSSTAALPGLPHFPLFPMDLHEL